MAEVNARLTGSSSSSPTSYTFLVADTSKPSDNQDGNNALEADKHDRFAHTRTKRKRTSPEDYAILEAEYQRDSKPDKNSRAKMALSVSMSEKEIQIWFQNRRQQSRRKRNTWQPNEITSIIRSSQDFSKDVSGSPSSSFDESAQTSQETAGDAVEVVDLAPEEGESFKTTTSQDSFLEPVSQDTTIFSQTTTTVAIKDVEESQNASVLPGSTGDSTSTAFTPRKLKRTSSMVRLAMSLDGEASVILRGETPSPPTKISSGNARIGLQRSKSMIAPSTLETSSQDVPQAPLTGVPRIPGRSRDTRNWEFWCDSERREQLTKSAESNSRDSAAGPIALIRSNSSRKVETTKKRRCENILGERRPKLARTKSSGARLQSDATKKDYEITVFRDGDSDKENIDPNGSTIAGRRIATPRVLASKRQVLQENTNVPSHATSLGALLAKDKKVSSTKSSSKRTRRTLATMDQKNVAVDTEVTKFMSGGSEGDKSEDMDAVQNLLSLSQGAWKS